LKKSSPESQVIERHVGLRIRQRRILLGLTQQQLAELIGVTYQQAHKYERGVNRISAGRLYEIARVLGVGVGYFFEGTDDEGRRQLNQRQRLCLEVSRNFANIENESYQEAVSQLCRTLANSPDEDGEKSPTTEPLRQPFQ
jgi:transcriptional regulator with XRE-family HTH domain